MGKLISSSPLFSPGLPAEFPDQEILNFLKKHLRGKVLDYGGGNGVYAKALVEAGYDVVLGEINKDYLKAAEYEGLQVIDLNDFKKNDGDFKFDSAILIEVLEHISDYENVLKELKGSGIKRILFTVPCNDDFHWLFSHGLTYGHIAVSDHINQFTSTEIKNILEKLNCNYTLTKGSYLFPYHLNLMYGELFKIKWMAKGFVFMNKLLKRAGFLKMGAPSRIFAVADLM